VLTLLFTHDLILFTKYYFNIRCHCFALAEWEGVKKQNESEDLPFALPFVAFGEKAKNRQNLFLSILTILPFVAND